MCSNTNTIFNKHPLPIFPQTRKTYQNPTRIAFPTRPNRIQLRASVNTGSVTYSPPEPTQTLYEILGISSPNNNNNNNNNNSNNNYYGVTLLEIKKAYKEMALRYHPDLSPPGRVEEYTVRFIRVQEAYETLSDPNRRALYDGDLAMGFNFALHSRRPYYHRNAADHMETDDKSEWKSRWQSQLSELKFRSANKSSRGSMSWSEKIRRQNENLSNEV